MSQYSRSLAKFLAQTYYPVTVTFKSIPLAYSNPLFSVSHRINASKYTDNSCETGYVHFETALNKYHQSRFCNNNKLNTPESFIKYMLDKPTSHSTFQLNKIKNDNTNDNKNDNKSELVEFNTNAIVPIRYIDMINDFTPYKFEYKKPTKTDIKLYETELYETKIASFNSDILYDIYQYAKYLAEKDRIFKIIVSKAPVYPFDKNFLKKYNYGTFRQEESDEYIHHSLKNREWLSGDGDFSSVATKIFFNRSCQLKSLNNIGYKKLFSSSGGIDFSYAGKLPWFELKQKMGDLQQYYDVSGREEYYSFSDNIGSTEFILFSETLAKEGAEFQLEL